jgi:hypothetical protein
MADRNYLSFVKEKGTILTSFEPPANPAEWDDLLKFSDCQSVTVSGITVPGGARENALDAVRGKGYYFVDSEFGNGGVSSVTLKGAIDGWVFERCTFGDKIEVGQFDDYWFPGRKPTRNGLISDCHSTTGKVLVELWDAEAPLTPFTDTKVVKVPKWKWLPYFLFRYLCVKLVKLLKK